MGKLFLTYVSLLLHAVLACLFLPFSPIRAQAPPIELDRRGVVVVPPPPEALSDKTEAEQQAWEKRRKKRPRDRVPQKPLNPEEKRFEKLMNEAKASRPYVWMSHITMVLPSLRTRGPRKLYTSDLTSHFSMFYRLTSGPPIGESHLWTGFRLAPFAGSGIYAGLPARYGFTYFGPMLGIGKVDRPEAEPSQSMGGGERKDDAKAEMPQAYGWFLMGGIAAHTRIAQHESSAAEADRDMNTVRGSSVDGLGLWAELTYSVIHYGALGSNYVAGIQLAEGKAFIWLGLGLGGWY